MQILLDIHSRMPLHYISFFSNQEFFVRKYLLPLLLSLFFLGNVNSMAALADHSDEAFFSDHGIIFSGNANQPLAKEVANYLNVSLGNASVTRFSDGEIKIQILESVRDKDVFIIQPTCPTATQSVNDNIMELFLLVRTMKRASAASITAVVPYFGYARQDRKNTSRVPISAADIAWFLEVAGVNRVLTIDLHCGQIQGFFHDAPVDNLEASVVFVPYFSQMDLHNVVVVSPDAGGVDRAKTFLERLGKHGVYGKMAIISKQRVQAGVIESMNLIGDVSNSDVIIVDDICDTAGTLVQAAQLLKDHGALRVFAAITHPVFSGPALKRISDSVIDELVISDTVPLKEGMPPNIRCLSVAPLLGEAIRRIYLGESVSALFKS